jgi:uncharacterized membrane protein
MTSTTLVGRILQLIFIIYGEKFEKFNGLNFKNENKIYYLTTLNLVKFLNKDVKKLVDKDFIPLI